VAGAGGNGIEHDDDRAGELIARLLAFKLAYLDTHTMPPRRRKEIA
jgi:hypothetical protein